MGSKCGWTCAVMWLLSVLIIARSVSETLAAYVALAPVLFHLLIAALDISDMVKKVLRWARTSR